MALDDGWMERGSCQQVEDIRVFFPIQRKGIRPDYSEAQKICAGCPVRVPCLYYAIAHNVPYGCWGGYTPDERKHIARETKVKYRKRWWKLHPQSRPSRRK